MQSINSSKTLPVIFIDLFQPGDRGNFVIRVVDATTQKVMGQNLLPEHIGDVQYLYTARLLEQRAGPIKPGAPKDDSWKKTDRYTDVVRYGQKLYDDLFGEKGELRNVVRRANHLKDGAQYVLRMFNTASELWNIPWEYLHDGKQFLAVDGQSNIVRTTPDIPLDQNAQRLAETPYPLRILLCLSDPHGVSPLNIDREVKTIVGALQPSIDAGQVELDIIEEGSIANLDMNLSYEPYHVLYYTGHGAMTPQGSVLVMEDDQGEVELANLTKILAVLRKTNSLRLVILSACQSGQIDESQAASGIATGLLEVVPAVVAMQFSILDMSAQLFARTFFQSASQGVTLENAMHTARVAMNQANPALTDWGIPTLYVQKLGMRLVDPRQAGERRAAAVTKQPTSLPQPPLFVGRRDEQRKLRQRLPFLGFNVFYLWGMAGIGKSALAARVLERPGRKGILDSVLVIPCQQTPPPQMLEKMVNWLASTFPDAANVLRNPKLPPDRRLTMAAPLVQQRRMVLVFDQFDAYMAQTNDRDHWDIPSPALAAFFRAVATAPWSILTIFTSRYRWKFLNDLDETRCEEIHLGQLSFHEAVMLIQGLEHLKELGPEALSELLSHVGGHPMSLYGFDAQASKNKQRLIAVLDNAPQTLIQSSGPAFMDGLVGLLSPVEHEALQQLAVLDSAFWTDDVQFAAGVPAKQEAEGMLRHWEALSLAYFVQHYPGDNTDCYEIPRLVRTFLLSGCPPNRMKELHRKAAALLERKFVILGEERWSRGEGPAPIQESSYEKARRELRLVVVHASHEVMAILIGRALSWRRHLMQIEEYEKAASIVNDVWSVIKQRYGEPDLARELLEETIKTTTGRSQYLAQINYSTFLIGDGAFEEALQMLESVCRKASQDGDWTNAGVALTNQADIHFRQGKLEKAKKTAEQALQLYKKAGEVIGEVAALKQGADYYARKEKYTDALKLLDMAASLLQDRRSKGDLLELMEVIYMKGTNYRRLRDFQAAIKCYQVAYDMAQQLGSLGQIGRALGEMGNLLRQVGQLGDAARFTLDAISVAEQLKDYIGLASRLHGLALIYEQQGSASDALVQAERALALAKAHNPSAVKTIQETVSRLRRRR